jgi:hypothetical protein
MKRILTPLLLLCAGICAGMMLMRLYSKPQIPEPKIIRDTTLITQIDTQYFPKPVPYKVEVRDTILLTDTVFVGGQMLFQEVKEYKDSTYYAKISGINAFLEEIKVYPKTTTKYVYQVEKVAESPDKWVLYSKAEYESIAEQNFAKIGGGLEYKDKGNTFAAEGGKELISGQWYFKGVYKRDIFGWK